MMRRLVMLILIFFSFNALATANEIVVGLLRQSTSEQMDNGERSAPRPGWGLGARTESDAWQGFTIKLGLMYEQRAITGIFSGVEHNPEFKTLDLQTLISYHVTDYFSVYAGPKYAVLLSSECKPTSGPCLIGAGAKKYFVPVEAGFDFTFDTNYGVEVFYESISQETWEKVFEKTQTYGINLKYKF